MENEHLIKAIKERHSVRKYLDKPIEPNVVAELSKLINEINAKGNLNMQLVTDEPKAFRGIFAYGKFYGVRNYIVITGEKAPDLDDRVGYWGELLVLKAQTMGLNTCWVGLSYTKVAGTFTLLPGHKVVCYIALGYGENLGVSHKSNTPEQVSNIAENSPQWFRQGVEAALLAPTAINQQKFYFEYLGDDKVIAHRKFSAVGYTHIDLGIAIRHFEIASGKTVLKK